MIYYCSEVGWEQFFIYFFVVEYQICEDDFNLDDFDNWFDCVGYLFELDGVLLLLVDLVECDVEFW